MTLSEISAEYDRSAQLIAQRLRDLRQAERECTEADRRDHLHRRILDLKPLLQQCRELQALTEHYYDRSFTRDGKYCL